VIKLPRVDVYEMVSIISFGIVLGIRAKSLVP
jgi:hypothetical protein